jgi:hypothetical protein
VWEEKGPAPAERRPAAGFDFEDAVRGFLAAQCEDLATTTVYVALAGESVEAWRPVAAEPAGDGLYLLCGRREPAERWAFPPGSLVRCEWRRLDGRDLLLAVAAA